MKALVDVLQFWDPFHKKNLTSKRKMISVPYTQVSVTVS